MDMKGRREGEFIGAADSRTSTGVIADIDGKTADASPDVVRPFSEIHGGVWRVYVACWLAFIGVLLIAFSGTLLTVFTLGVVVTFGAAFFGVPIILVRIGKRIPPMVNRDSVQTWTGTVSQKEASVQILLIPVLLTFGMAAIGYLATHAR